MLTSSTRSPQIHKSTSLNLMTLDLTWSPRSPQLYRLPTPCCSSTWSVWCWSTDLDNFADLKITGGVTRVAGGRGGERLRLVLLLRGEANKDSTLQIHKYKYKDKTILARIHICHFAQTLLCASQHKTQAVALESRSGRTPSSSPLLVLLYLSWRVKDLLSSPLKSSPAWSASEKTLLEQPLCRSFISYHFQIAMKELWL